MEKKITNFGKQAGSLNRIWRSTNIQTLLLDGARDFKVNQITWEQDFCFSEGEFTQNRGG
jgi:hypothetical protein